MLDEKGWVIRVIHNTSDNSVTLSDGISFSSDCFADANIGETWAVRYEEGGFLGVIRRAVLLESARSTK